MSFKIGDIVRIKDGSLPKDFHLQTYPSFEFLPPPTRNSLFEIYKFNFIDNDIVYLNEVDGDGKFIAYLFSHSFEKAKKQNHRLTTIFK